MSGAGGAIGRDCADDGPRQRSRQGRERPHGLARGPHLGRRAYLDNGFTGAHQPYVVDRLTVLGTCEPRSSLRERPDRCETCGNYRDVGPQSSLPEAPTGGTS